MTTNATATNATQPQAYNDDMRGVLYKNKQKTDAKHPSARGRACIEGVWHWMSSWTQHSKHTGERYQSIAFTKMTDSEVEQYITNRSNNSNNQGQTQAQTQTQSANSTENANHADQSYQQYAEYNTDGSVRPSNEPKDFDNDIPF